MITAIAIDDEPKAIEVIQHHVSQIESLELLAHFYNANDALEFLKQQPIDLIFVDINMPNMSGLELIEKLQVKPAVIFTTAYSEFAVDSYTYNAVDYLLKPFDFDRFYLAVQKAEKQLEIETKTKEFFFVKDGFKNIKIAVESVLYVKGSGNYLDIVTIQKTHTPRMTFLALFEKLPASLFARVHQSYLVKIAAIDKIENNHVYIKYDTIPISARYKDSFFKQLNL